MSWAEEELQATELGDRRRTERLVKIVEDLVAQPSESVPQASRDNAAMQGIYDFWLNRQINSKCKIKNAKLRGKDVRACAHNGADI